MSPRENSRFRKDSKKAWISFRLKFVKRVRCDSTEAATEYYFQRRNGDMIRINYSSYFPYGEAMNASLRDLSIPEKYCFSLLNGLCPLICLPRSVLGFPLA